MRRAAGGFTLLEVLVAISIFALIGLASYRVLSSVMMTDERLEARSDKLRSINRAFWLMQQDIEQLALRPVRGADGGTDAYLIVHNQNGQAPLQFTRAGRANPLGLPRSSLQRVAYRVDRHPDYDQPESPHYREDRWYLLRDTWAELDGSGNREQAQTQVLLPDIEKLSVNVFTDSGPVPEWPPAEQPDGQEPEPPLALQLEFTHTEWGSVRRSFKVL